ncbi:MAG TPA: hypothetical protein PKX07_20055, partial [Aggregatilineales bacterium]|nr:hypothetical protein [Aggregatilineales bacterium]
CDVKLTILTIPPRGKVVSFFAISNHSLGFCGTDQLVSESDATVSGANAPVTVFAISRNARLALHR